MNPRSRHFLESFSELLLWVSPKREEGSGFRGKLEHMHLPIQNIGRQRELNLDRRQTLV